MATDLKFIGRSRIAGRLELLSGLHIGAGKDQIEIGGLDNPVITHPHTREPFIPGSSLKGKLRFLMEWAFDSIEGDGAPWGGEADRDYDGDDPVLRIFGTTHKGWKSGPTRLMVRDAPLGRAWVEEMLHNGLPLTESKTEVVIDRLQGKALDRVGPRQTERVPAGAVFEVELVFRHYAVGDGGARDMQCLNWLIAGMKILEQDAIGGSGSRGYGRVRFAGLTARVLDGETVDMQERFDAIASFDASAPPAIVGP